MSEEYIKKEEALDLLGEPITMSMCLSVDECKSKRGQREIDYALIKAIPAADVRPVVLCRDCKYAPIGDKDGSDLEWPFKEFDENPCPYKCLDNWYSRKPAPDFFCADGKKREEE